MRQWGIIAWGVFAGDSIVSMPIFLLCMDWYHNTTRQCGTTRSDESWLEGAYCGTMDDHNVVAGRDDALPEMST